MFVYYCLMAKLIKKMHNEPNKCEINVFRNLIVELIDC